MLFVARKLLTCSLIIDIIVTFVLKLNFEVIKHRRGKQQRFRYQRLSDVQWCYSGDFAIVWGKELSSTEQCGNGHSGDKIMFFVYSGNMKEPKNIKR